jgi:hypothetical protein
MTEPSPYKEAYPAGTEVRIADRRFLVHFMETWQYHHKLSTDQLEYADRLTVVEDVAFYHGGDPVYKLRQIPGSWLEQCLRPAKKK